MKNPTETKLIRTDGYESISKAWLRHFEGVAKGKEYVIKTVQRYNTLGFSTTDYEIHQLIK